MDDLSLENADLKQQILQLTAELEAYKVYKAGRKESVRAHFRVLLENERLYTALEDAAFHLCGGTTPESDSMKVAVEIIKDALKGESE